MSIEMDNPRTTLERVDAAWNYIAQLRLALIAGDRAHAFKCIDEASRLLSVAVEDLQLKEEKR
jgi:hypothetical protein